MQYTSLARIIATTMMLALLVAIGASQEKNATGQKKPQKDLSEEELLLLAKKAHPLPTGPAFYLEPIQGTNQFSVLLTDANNVSLPGIVTARELEIFEGLLVAAKEFALSDEAVGGGSPVTTRLMNKDASTLIVDVSKVGNKSKIYVTLNGLKGRLTTEVGEVIRGSKKEPGGLFLKLLSQVQEARAARPQQ